MTDELPSGKPVLNAVEQKLRDHIQQSIMGQTDTPTLFDALNSILRMHDPRRHELQGNAKVRQDKIIEAYDKLAHDLRNLFPPPASPNHRVITLHHQAPLGIPVAVYAAGVGRAMGNAPYLNLEGQKAFGKSDKPTTTGIDNAQAS